MAEVAGTLGGISERELLAKAKELQAPRSFATAALAGLTLYMHDCKDDRVLGMLDEGIKFCGVCIRDFNAYEEGEQYSGKRPRYYSPSEVLPSDANIPDLKEKVLKVEQILKSIVDRREAINSERIIECHQIIEEILAPYRKQAAVSIGKFKYGPTLQK